MATQFRMPPPTMALFSNWFDILRRFRAPRGMLQDSARRVAFEETCRRSDLSNLAAHARDIYQEWGASLGVETPGLRDLVDKVREVLQRNEPIPRLTEVLDLAVADVHELAEALERERQIHLALKAGRNLLVLRRLSRTDGFIEFASIVGPNKKWRSSVRDGLRRLHDLGLVLKKPHARISGRVVRNWWGISPDGRSWLEKMQADGQAETQNAM